MNGHWNMPPCLGWALALIVVLLLLNVAGQPITGCP